jgi:hypothetical protein
VVRWLLGSLRKTTAVHHVPDGVLGGFRSDFRPVFQSDGLLSISASFPVTDSQLCSFHENRQPAGGAKRSVSTSDPESYSNAVMQGKVAV